MSDWTNLELGSSLEVLIDNRGKNPPYEADGVPTVSGMTVSPGVLNLGSARRVSHETWRRWMPEPSKRNDVVLTSEAPLGRAALVPTDDPLVLAQRVFGLRGRPGVLDSRFLYYAFLTVAVQADLQGRATGTTVLGIRQPALKKVRIPAPGYAEQKAIAEVLGALDDKIAANAKLAATAHELAAHIYGQAIHPLGVVPMSSVLSPVLGGTPPRSQDEYWDGDQLWASAKDITGAEFATVVDTEEKISVSAVQGTKAKPLPAGSVILTARGTVGAVARLAVPSSFNQSCYGFIPGTVPPGVLYFSIIDATQRAKAIAHGSVFDTITMKTFDHLEFPNFVGDTMALAEANITPLLDLVTGAVVENQTLAATRDALLPQLMSGKMRIKDANPIAAAAV